MKKYIFLILILLSLFNYSFAQWQADVRLTNDTAYSRTSDNNAWCIASSGNLVNIVWFDPRDGNYEIYYKRSTDGGISWGADTRLTNDTGFSGYPCIAVFNQIIHVVWHDFTYGYSNIFYLHSTDGGTNWGTRTPLTFNNANSHAPSVSVSGSFVHVVWFSEIGFLNYEIYYKRSTDGGVSWDGETQLSNSSGHESVFPSISVSGSIIHVVWEDTRNGNSEVYYKRSTDGGISWGEDTRLTNNSAISLRPSIAVSNQIVHVVWFDKRDGNEEIYYKRSINGGLSWGTDTRLTNDNATSWFASISASLSFVHVTWQDNRDGNSEIYYKCSTNGGLSWGVDTRLTNDTASSILSSLAISNQNVHVVWQDNRDGNYEIYYKRNPNGNSIGIENNSSNIPKEFTLYQNYPNPFNPATNIKFDIPESGDVKLVVYDVLGQEVVTLVNEHLKPGTYETEWDGSDHSSGVYFYKLITADFTETKRMVLVK